MKTNAMYSGTVGTVRHPDTNVRPVWPTIVKLVFACGPIKYRNAETKASSIKLINFSVVGVVVVVFLFEISLYVTASFRWLWPDAKPKTYLMCKNYCEICVSVTTHKMGVSYILIYETMCYLLCWYTHIILIVRVKHVECRIKFKFIVK